MITMYNAYGYIVFVLAGKNKCGGGGDLRRILRKCYIGLRIDEKVGNHCSRIMMNTIFD